MPVAADGKLYPFMFFRHVEAQQRLHFFILVSAYTNIALLTQVLACWMKNNNLAPHRRSQGIREVDSLFAEFAKFAVKKKIVVKKLNRNTQYFGYATRASEMRNPMNTD